MACFLGLKDACPLRRNPHGRRSSRRGCSEWHSRRWKCFFALMGFAWFWVGSGGTGFSWVRAPVSRETAELYGAAGLRGRTPSGFCWAFVPFAHECNLQQRLRRRAPTSIGIPQLWRQGASSRPALWPRAVSPVAGSRRAHQHRRRLRIRRRCCEGERLKARAG
jgi:hypothetical protein